MERLSMVDADGHEVAGMDVTSMRRQLKGRFISLARQERFDLAVGADGLHSQVRELTFGPEVKFETPLGCHVAAFRLSGYPRRDELIYVSHTVSKRHVARVALRNDETLVLLICRSELIDGDPPREQQKTVLRRAFGAMKWEVPEILDRMDEVDDVYFDRVSQIQLAHWSAGRVAVIGDAAACASLLAGEGTGLAMTQAYVLAGELHDAGGDIARALGAFEARLHSFVTTKQKTALRFRSFFAPRTKVGLHLRNVAVNALSIPFFANRLIGGSLRDDFVLPDTQSGFGSWPRVSTTRTPPTCFHRLVFQRCCYGETPIGVRH